MAGDGIHVNVAGNILGCNTPRGLFLDEFFHGIDNFLAATVAHGNIDGDTGVVVGIAHSIPEALCNVVRQKIKVSDQPHAAVGFRGGEFCNNVGD